MDVSRAGRVDAGEQLREGFFLLFGEGLLDGAFGPRSRRILQYFTSLLDFAGILGSHQRPIPLSATKAGHPMAEMDDVQNAANLLFEQW